MARHLTLTAVLVVITLTGCGSNGNVSTDPALQGSSASDAIAHDLNTPEGAILSLEDAYRDQDIEAVVRCKDFTIEATLMLQKLQHELSGDQEILSKTAEVLELGFRSEMIQSGFPDFQGIVSTFASKKPFQGRDDIVEIIEHCRQRNGNLATNKLVVAKTANGWKVVSVPD